MLNRTTLLAALLTLTLGACAGMGPKPTTETVDLGNTKDGQIWTDKNGKPMPSPSDKVDLSYSRMAGEMTEGGVQMFALDGPSQPIQKIDRHTAGTGTYGMTGVPSSTDDSVTVFPFSDDMYTPGVKAGFHGYGRKPGSSVQTYGGDGTMLPMPSSASYNLPGTGKTGAAGTMRPDLNTLPMAEGNPNTIYFEHGSAALNGAAREVIAKVAKNYGGMVQIDGHASHRTGIKDPVKASLANFQMSMKRAMAVTRKLLLEGVPAKSIKMTAHGDGEPLVDPEQGLEAERKNRRVEIRTGGR